MAVVYSLIDVHFALWRLLLPGVEYILYENILDVLISALTD